MGCEIDKWGKTVTHSVYQGTETFSCRYFSCPPVYNFFVKENIFLIKKVKDSFQPVQQGQGTHQKSCIEFDEHTANFITQWEDISLQ